MYSLCGRCSLFAKAHEGNGTAGKCKRIRSRERGKN